MSIVLPMTVTYDGTVFEMSSANAPDAMIPVDVDHAGAVRRNYYGTASSWERWRKHTVELTWTGITAAVLGSIQPLSEYTGIVYGTNFDGDMFGATSVNFRVITDSWSAELSGLNAYTVKLTMVEQ